jgi:hypothetical protein
MTIQTEQIVLLPFHYAVMVSDVDIKLMRTKFG